MPEVDGVPCEVWEKLDYSGWEDDELLAMALRYMKNKGLLKEWINQIDIKGEHE